MNKKHLKGWMKHWDFILLDIFCLQLSFVVSYWIRNGFDLQNAYTTWSSQLLATLLFVSQLLAILFFNNYSGILRRKKFDEAISVIKYLLEIFLMTIFAMFVIKESGTVSRLQVGITAGVFFILDLLFRDILKIALQSRKGEKTKKSLVLVTSARLVSEAIEKMTNSDTYCDFTITRIILLDAQMPETVPEYNNVPVSLLNEETIREISHDWVDEAFILQPDDMTFPMPLMDDLMTMGITVNYTMSAICDDRWPNTDIRKLGRYKVLINGYRFANAGQLAIKRMIDIVGGIVGCILTGIIFLFLAPAIYIADPGPIFFSQDRIGKNGKKFRIYKFRSMYMDAEERKAELMKHNKMNGLMFKMDNDPRIIGSEKKDKNGKPKGIGNFIRNTSLDEFPQFLNVLLGQCSLVGWRPCTVSEWEKYSLKHRIRASMKPGITGMWQVSGRSQITDFDEIVRMDREYIENWNLALDIKILLKTVVVVLARKGAE